MWTQESSFRTSACSVTTTSTIGPINLLTFPPTLPGFSTECGYRFSSRRISLEQNSFSFPQLFGVGKIAPEETRDHGIVLLDLSAEEHSAALDVILRLTDEPHDPGRVADLQVGPQSVDVA